MIFITKFTKKSTKYHKVQKSFLLLIGESVQMCVFKKSSLGRPWEGKGYPPLSEKKNFFAFLHHLGHKQKIKKEVWKGMSHPPSCMEFFVNYWTLPLLFSSNIFIFFCQKEIDWWLTHTIYLFTACCLLCNWCCVIKPIIYIQNLIER